MSARARRQRTAACVLAAFCGVAAACTYDFDKYVTPKSNGAAGRASGAGSGGSNAGRAGSASAGTTSVTAGSGGSGAAGQAGASDGGATDDGGSGAMPNNGGSAGRGGTSAGGAGAGGTSAGQAGAGAPNGGKAGSGSAGNTSVDCSDGTAHDGHCYFLVGTSGGLDFEHAKSECDAHDAHLVTITSSGEQMFVATTFFPSSDDAWIGLSLEDTKSDPSLCKLLPDSCPFLWVTDEKLDYDAWAMRSGDDEPNYTGACVRLQAADQAWADTGCSSEFRAVCERDH